MKKFLLPAAVCALATSAHGATIVENFSNGFVAADGSAFTIPVSQFDPSLGVLQSVEISATSTTTGGSVVFDPDTPGDRTLEIGASVEISGPVSIVLNPTPLETQTFTGLVPAVPDTPADDVSLVGSGASDSDSLVRNDPPFDLSPYIGTGTFDLDITGDSETGSTGTSTGSTTDDVPDYDLNGSVTYTYVIPEPSSALLVGLAGFGLLIRRRA